ncbi:ComF family protein [Qipengyuania atrilutea]|uniref:ComF family protein n=1 Tax=Qipengyuania atrilutea TaxID=2744473 RepID=UPI001CED0AD8|nr:phosphoribosyltransferase family protein [Actirhodobacter atriluteus]
MHSGIAAGTIYNDTSRKLVLAFKHGRRIALARLLASFIAARLPADTADYLIVPVPLHRLRLWQRGFNQAALLARDLERLGKGRLIVDGLVRRKYTRPLGNLGQQERKQILAGSIHVNARRAERLENAKVILVDDVLTSGATTNVCTDVLKQAGASEIVIACAARKLR